MSPRQSTVAVVGAGLMGRGMAQRIQAAGHDLVVVAHRTRTVIDELVAAGATECETPREAAARSDVVLTCLPNADVVEQVLLGDDGVVHGGRPVVVLECSTSLPERSKAYAERLDEAGIGFVDAPITGGPAEAERGELVALLGGRPADLDRVRPVVDAFSATVHVFGGVGTGHAAKLISNGIGFGILGVVSEALTVAMKHDLDLPSLLAMVERSGSQNRVLQGLAPWLLQGELEFPRVTVATARKDVAYFARLSHDAGVAAPVNAAVLHELDRIADGPAGERMLPAYPAAIAAEHGVSPAPRSDQTREVVAR